MRYPYVHLYKKAVQWLMVFILGMLTGAGLFMFMIGPQYEQLVTENQHLKNDNAELAERVEEWKERDKKRKSSKPTVQEIIVVVGESNKMSLFEMEVAKKVKRDMDWMIGKSLENVMEVHAGIRTLLDNKSYEIDSRQVTVELQTLIIQKKVYLYLVASVENT